MRKAHLGTLAFGALVLFAFAGFYSIELHNRELRDFGTFWASGDAALHDRAPYAVYPLTWRVHVRATGQIVLDPNLSPPALLPVFEAIALWNPKREVVLWTFAGACAFLGSTLLVAFAAGFTVPRRNLLWMLLAPAVLHSLWLGQDYAFLALLSALAWLCFRYGRDSTAGIVIGILCAAKPNLLLWPLLLLLAGQRRSANAALAAFAILSALPVLLYGPGIYVEWLHAVALTNHSMFPTDVSLMGYAARLGARPVGIALAVLLAAAVSVWTYRRRPTLFDLSGVAICASLLCSPLAWFHYVVILMPWMAAQRWNRAATLSAILLMWPVDATMMTVGAHGWRAVYGSMPYVLAVAFAMAWFIWQSYCVESSIIGRPLLPVFAAIDSSPSNVSKIM